MIHQLNIEIIKKDYKKKLVKDNKVFLKEKTKCDNIVVKMMKNKSLLNIEKNIIK